MTDDVMRVKPWGKGQGDYVLINVSDFDPERHEAIDQPPATGSVGADFLDRNAPEIIAELGALNADELAGVLAAEVSGKNRAGVIAAINKAMG